MTILGLVFATNFPWALLHFIKAFYARSVQKPSFPLPLSLSGDGGASRNRRGSWDIGPLWLKYETTRWNTLFSTSFLLSIFRSRMRHSLESRSPRFARLARWSVWFYAVGAALCVLAMFVGMALLFWSAVGLVLRVGRLLVGEGGNGGRVVKHVVEKIKRSYEDATAVAVVESERPTLHALIPGVTLPLSHLPVLLCALALSGIIHEAGHAIVASLENVPVLSTGFHVHLVFPTFFVALSQGTLDTLPTPSRLRIATAGAWHNFVTWALLALLGFSVFSISDLYPSSLSPSSTHDLSDNKVCTPASVSSCSTSPLTASRIVPSRLWSYFGYDNALWRGIVVTYVESDYPLHGHLVPGSIITRVDDVRLGGMDNTGFASLNAYNRWYGHLSMNSAQWVKKVEEEPGWCVPETWFNRQPTTCCHHSTGNSTAHHHESEGPESCFNSLKKASDDLYTDKDHTKGRCLDPVSLFTYQHSVGSGKTPKNPTTNFTSPSPSDSNGIRSKDGSAYGSRCHVACLRADGDNEEYVCARPQVRVDRAAGGVDPTEERLLRLEIEDPPWIQPAPTSSSSDTQSDSQTHIRGGPPQPHEYRGDPHHRSTQVRPTRILVYKGPTTEILSHVSIGALQPRSKHLPVLIPHYIGTSIPGLLSLFWEYVARLSLSLAFFNLLPIMGLDGGVVLSCLLEWWLGSNGDGSGAEEYDVELLERGVETRTNTGWTGDVAKKKEKIEKSTSILTIVLGIAVAIATLLKDVG